MSEMKEIDNEMRIESENRAEIMKEVANNIDYYSNQILELENKVKDYELLEIKYKNQNREIEEYIKLYETKSKTFDKQSESLQKELSEARKNEMQYKMISSNLKSILVSIITHIGVDKVVEITGIDKERIEKYLQDEA